jgi:predicted metal-dependent phosphoesterase TrpH
VRWLAADFHAHTVHSDGALGIEELAALAVSRGLDALAVTDHNTTSHHAYLPSVGERYAIRLIPGQEITTDRGHANTLGTSGSSTSGTRGRSRSATSRIEAVSCR